MMTSNSRARVLAAVALIGAAAGGVIGAHALDYLLVFRDSATRMHLLASSGHSYMPSAVASAALGAFIGLALMFCIGWARGTNRHGTTLRFGTAFARLAALQVTGFVLLEALERVQAGIPAHHLWSPILPAGVLLQVLTAAVGALLLVLVLRLGTQIARARSTRKRPSARTISFGLPADASKPSNIRLDDAPSRAPPALRAA